PGVILLAAQEFAQTKRRQFVTLPGIVSSAACLPDFSENTGSLVGFVQVPQQAGFFQFQQAALRIRRDQLTVERERFLEAALPPEKNHENNLRVDAALFPIF